MRRIVIAGLLIGAACGSATETDVRTRTGPTQFAGKHALFWLMDVTLSEIGADLADGGTTTAGPMPASELVLSIQDVPMGCGGLDADAGQSTVATLEFDVTRIRPGAITTGDYPLSPISGSASSDRTSAAYHELRGVCVAPFGVTDGRMTLSRLTDQEAQGLLSVVLDDGTEIDGEFIAGRCTNLLGYSPGDPVPVPTPLCGQ